ncbi:hypothetical protein ACSMXM_10435 [Pacificimonas sp. ICDLI1SI03]
MNAGRFAARLREEGARRVAAAQARHSRHAVSALKREAGLNAEAQGDEVRVRLNGAGDALNDGRLRWLSLWGRELVR